MAGTSTLSLLTLHQQTPLPETQQESHEHHEELILITNKAGKEIAQEVAEGLRQELRELITIAFADGEYDHYLDIASEDTKKKKIVAIIGNEQNAPLGQMEAIHLAEKCTKMGKDIDMYLTYFDGARKTKMDRPGNILTGPQFLSVLRKIGVEGTIGGLGLHDKVEVYIEKQIQDLNERALMTEGILQNYIRRQQRKVENHEEITKEEEAELEKELEKLRAATEEICSDQFLTHLIENTVGEEEARTYSTSQTIAYERHTYELKHLLHTPWPHYHDPERYFKGEEKLVYIKEHIEAMKELYIHLYLFLTKEEVLTQVENLSLRSVHVASITSYLRERNIGLEDIAGCGPDYSAYKKMLIPLLTELTGMPEEEQLLAWADKYRDTRKQDSVELTQIHQKENLHDRYVLIYDDIFGTGGTMENALREIHLPEKNKKTPKGVLLVIDHPHIALKKEVKETRTITYNQQNEKEIFIQKEESYAALNKMITWKKEGLVDTIFITNSIPWLVEEAKKANLLFPEHNPLFVISSVAPVLIDRIRNGKPKRKGSHVR